MIYDLSPPIDADLAVWPGDTPFTRRATATLAAGESANVGAIETTVHLGTHLDAPLHTEENGAPIDQVALEACLGPCRVLDLTGVATIEAEHLPDLSADVPPRLLFKTGSWQDRSRFPERFSTFSHQAAQALAAARVLLVGLDTPSVDAEDEHALGAHHALAGAGILILEGLVLDAVPAGDYELIALPLKLRGMDASPVRAVLRSL